MKVKNFIVCLIVLVAVFLDRGPDFEEYENLEKTDVLTIRKEDLPDDFSDSSYSLVVDFIQKTHRLDCEWLLYFDYCTGEILKCIKGKKDSVDLNFTDDEFDEYNVASIHNHPPEVLSAPSGKNFGILGRDFEDYELIAGFENFWILEAKGTYYDLIDELNNVSEILFEVSLLYCIGRYNDDKIIGKMQDIRYGSELLKYINDKNISGIQLVKKEYFKMINNSKTATYNCRKKITNPETLQFLREFEKNPYTPNAKDIYTIFIRKSVGMWTMTVFLQINVISINTHIKTHENT